MEHISAFERKLRVGTAPVERDLFDAVARWCDALSGSVPLSQALAQFASGLGAEAAMIVRTHRSDQRPCPVVIHDRRGESVPRPLRMSFADSYFGADMILSRGASVWVGSTHADETRSDCSPALKEWQSSRHFNEFVVLVLNCGSATRDLLELHFPEPLSRQQLVYLDAIVPTICRTWAARQVGLITRTVVNHRLAHQPTLQQSSSCDLLDAANPSRLSRAEFRVCVLLSRGLSVAGVAEELGSSDATIRTHLRNIYAKSNLSSLAELVFVLLRPSSSNNQSNVRCA